MSPNNNSLYKFNKELNNKRFSPPTISFVFVFISEDMDKLMSITFSTPDTSSKDKPNSKALTNTLSHNAPRSNLESSLNSQ
jgi:hypothetical protein